MAMILMAAYTNYRRDPRVRREAEALVKTGHSVVFLARRQPGEPNREVLEGVEVIKTAYLFQRCTSIWEYILDYSTFFLAISAHMTAHPRRYKLIHINNMPDFLVFAAWLPLMLGCPVIHDVHDLMPELYSEKFESRGKSLFIAALKMQERWAGKFASAVLTVEEGFKDILSERGIPRDKIEVLMNLPDERVFSPRKAVAPKLENAPFVMVYHGTLARRLGLDIAIEAVDRVRTSIPFIKLRIIGAGEERSRLIELRDKLQLQEKVTFSDGFVPVEEIPLMINDADVGVIPLRRSSGTDIMLPTKLLEYAGIGIPCIVPKTDTIYRYFDEQMVEFFEAEDVDSLSNAILRLYRDPKKRDRLARVATERFSKKYNWSTEKNIYTNLVAKLLGK